MKKGNDHTAGRGGRPQKPVRRDQLMAIKCTLLERKVIEHKARTAQLTLSEYMRDMVLKGQIDSKEKALPKEVLLFTATLNHMAANLNQIAWKRNSGDELNALERAELQYLSGQIKQLAQDIKTYLQ